MACVVAQTASAGRALHSAANVQRNGVSDGSRLPGSAHNGAAIGSDKSGADASIRAHQQQLHELITSQQAAWATAGASAGPAVKVFDAAESGHPVLVSFPSFNDTSGELTASTSALEPHASTVQHPQAAAVQNSNIRPAGQQSASAGDLQHSVWQGSSSSCDSLPQHGASAGSCQHSSSGKRRGVSLLSQQIACARTLTAASAASPGDVDAIEAAGGASGRHQGQFWQYIQVGLGVGQVEGGGFSGCDCDWAMVVVVVRTRCLSAVLCWQRFVP
jgi:hypothetical protein